MLPEPVSNSPPPVDVAPAARLYRSAWRHIRNVCAFPAAYLIGAPMFLLAYLQGRVWSDVSIVDSFVGSTPVSATVLLLWLPLSFVAWALIGRYRWLLVSLIVGIGWSSLAVAYLPDSLPNLVREVIAGQQGGPSVLKGDQDGSASRIIRALWICWSTVLLVSGPIAVISALRLYVASFRKGRSRPVSGIARFAHIARRERQTYRAFDLRKLPLLAFAALAAAAFGYAANLAQSRFKRVALPELTYSTFEDSVAIIRNHPGKMVLGIAIELGTAFLIAAFAYLILRAAWRRVRLNAEQVLRQSNYKPTVYLRSFRDEDAEVMPKSLALSLQLRKCRLEEAVVGTLACLGPAVAIGKPGEGVPRLGALRAYYADEDWQEAVRRWVGGSRLVVAMAGISPWVLWEIRYLVESGAFGRLLLIVPPDQDAEARNRRWSSVCEALAGTPLQEALAAVAPECVLCVIFEAGGRAIPFVGDAQHQSDYEIAVQLATARLLGDASA